MELPTLWKFVLLCALLAAFLTLVMESFAPGGSAFSYVLRRSTFETALPLPWDWTSKDYCMPPALNLFAPYWEGEKLTGSLLRLSCQRLLPPSDPLLIMSSDMGMTSAPESGYIRPPPPKVGEFSRTFLLYLAAGLES